MGHGYLPHSWHVIIETINNLNAIFKKKITLVNNDITNNFNDRYSISTSKFVTKETKLVRLIML